MRLEHALELTCDLPIERGLRVSGVGCGACRITALDRGSIEFFLRHLLGEPGIGVTQLMSWVEQNDLPRQCAIGGRADRVIPLVIVPIRPTPVASIRASARAMITDRLRCIECEWHTEFVELVPPSGVAVVMQGASHVMQWGSKLLHKK